MLGVLSLAFKELVRREWMQWSWRIIHMEIWEIWQIMGITVLYVGDEEILYEQVESINVHVVNER